MTTCRSLRLAPAVGLFAALLVSATAGAQVPFTEVSVSAGVRVTHDPLGYYSGGDYAIQNSVGTGAAFVDLNGDRWLDLVVTNGTTPGNFCFLNNGDGTFTDISDRTGLRTGRVGNGVAAADLNNDHRPDLIISNHMAETSGFIGTQFSLSNQTATLGLNEVYFGTSEPPYGYEGPLNMGVALGDYDKDGYVDAFIANFNFTFDILLRNYGGSLFLDSKKVDEPLNATGRGCTPIFVDYDDDGDEDVFVVNDLMRDFMYRNEGRQNGWMFTEVALETKIAGGATTRDPLSMGMGGAAGDFDNDLDLDIYVTNFRANALWRNPGDWDGEGRHFFVNIAPEKNVDFPLNSWGCAFFDADNDGDLDLFMAGGWVEGGPDPQPREIPNRMWLNNGPPNYDFTDITAAAGMGDTQLGRSQAVGDYDRDGDLDVFLTNCSYYEPGAIGQGLSEVGTTLLYRNDSQNPNHWINLRLRGAGVHEDGSGCNLDAVGAKAYLTTGELTQMRVVQAGSGFMGQDSLELEFGLGAATAADRIEIRWICGATTVLQNVAADRFYRLFEEGGRLVAAPHVFEHFCILPTRDGLRLNWINSPGLQFPVVDIQRRLPESGDEKAGPKFESVELELAYEGNQVFALDPDVIEGQSYAYRLLLIDSEGEPSASPTVEIIAHLRPPLRAPVLGQNFPNPFNPTTTILFSLAKSGRVEILLHDARGRLVRHLYENELPAGADYSVEWNGDDDDGRKMASGVYYYTLNAGDSVQTRSLTLIK